MSTEALLVALVLVLAAIVAIQLRQIVLLSRLVDYLTGPEPVRALLERRGVGRAMLHARIAERLGKRAA